MQATKIAEFINASVSGLCPFFYNESMIIPSVISTEFQRSNHVRSGTFPGEPTVMRTIATTTMKTVSEQTKPSTIFFCHGMCARQTIFPETTMTSTNS